MNSPESLPTSQDVIDSLLAVGFISLNDDSPPEREAEGTRQSKISRQSSVSITKETATSAISEGSLEYSFASLQVTDEEWLAIEKETAHVSLSMSEKHDSQPPPTTASLSSSASSPSTIAAEVRRFKFSPSVLAHHANTACEKMLHLKGRQLWIKAQKQNTNSELADKGQEERAHSPVTETDATTQRGVVFESQLQGRIKNAVNCENDQDSFFRLATTPDNITLCQPIFSLDRSFYTKAMEKAGIAFGRFIPDFIKVLPGSIAPDGTTKKRLFIIDAKSSSHVKLSHQFQVTLYAIFLDHLIKVNKQTDLIEIDLQGGVWTPDCDDPHTFSLAFMRPIIENFIYMELPTILLRPLDQTVWHIDTPCNQCEFLDGCKKDAHDQKTLSLIPLLSKKSALAIKAMFLPKAAKREDKQNEIEDIEDLLKNRSSLSTLNQRFLKKELKLDDDGISPLLQSYKDQAIKVVPTKTMELPLNHNDRLLINLLIDPMTLMPYAYSLDMFKESRVRPIRSASGAARWWSHHDSKRLSSQFELAVELIDTLHEWLTNISELKPKSPFLSIFFYNHEMLNGLSSLLLKTISSKLHSSDITPTSVTRMRALDLLVNMYEDSSFLTLSEVSNFNVGLPDLLQLAQGFKKPYPTYDKRVFSIEKAVNTLLVLPVVGSYTFKDLMTYLVDVEAKYIIEDKDRNDDGFNSANIFHTWSTCSGLDAIKSTLQKWAEQQNVILFALYGVLRDKYKSLKPVLLAPQFPFRMRNRFDFKSQFLAKLAFFLQWEVIMQAQTRRQKRISTALDEAFQHQLAFQCRYLGRHIGALPVSSPKGPNSPVREPSEKPWAEFIGKFEIISPMRPGAISNDDFKTWILSPDTPAGENARMWYDEVNSVFKHFGSGIPALVSTPYFDPVTNIVYLGGTFRNMTAPDELSLKEGENYILERRELNFTLINSIKKLVEVNKEGSRLFLQLISNPNKWGEQRPDKNSDIFMESINKAARQYDMTISQEQAFGRVINNRLQIIWGPPGSGKTHFLALAIIRYVDILRKLALKGRGQGTQTIVLTAFTHTAINNLVKRVAKLHNDIAPHFGEENVVQPIVFYRLNSPQAVAVDGVQLVDPKGLGSLERNNVDSQENIIRIVSGTVWQIRHAASLETGVGYMRTVQMLMIDEGSQLLAADAIHAIECLDPDCGRLIVAGDHLQLGPVISGEYPESNLATDPTGSIMKNLMRKKDNTPVSLQWDNEAAAMDVGPCTFQLQDNFRMTKQLGIFMQSIYGPRYTVRNPGKTLPYSENVARGISIPSDLRPVLDPSISAVCIELRLTDNQHSALAANVRNDIHIAATIEASFIAGIVEAYLVMVGESAVTTLFVAVPHHVQRLAILNKIEETGFTASYPNALIKVDTIEKMQGQEADMVIVCFAMFDEFTLVNELAYLYNIHRWIVALSRARCKTVLLMTPEIKAPRIIGGTGKVNVGSLQRLDGWGLLQAFEKYAEELGGKLVWPLKDELLRGMGIHLL